jgi:hypothetical protein
MTKSFQSHKILMADFRQEMNLGAKDDRKANIKENQMKSEKINVLPLSVQELLYFDTTFNC